jgi:1,4-alpha-glucan branching enzyme
VILAPRQVARAPFEGHNPALMRALRRLRPVALLALAACASSNTPPAGKGTEPGAALGEGGTATQVPSNNNPDAGSDAAVLPAEIPMPPSGKHMGATVRDTGVAFRVWAPNAKSVSVAGEVAGPSPVPLAAEAGGTFAGRIEGARAGQRYHFVIISQDGTELSRLDPRSRKSDASESVVVDPRSYPWQSKPFKPAPRNETVLYELHIGSFNSPGGTGKGTFRSAIDKLDELAELGVNAIELMPVNQFGTTHGWGYNPQEYFAPHAAFGTPDDLRMLVDAAHEKGIAVLLDVVFNHYTGWDKAPLRCFDAPCKQGTYGAYFFEDAAYKTTPWGPRPDFAKKEVADYFVDNVFSWVSEYRIDGFRWDSVSNVRAVDGKGTVPGGVDLIKRGNQETRKALSSALIIAEDLKGSPDITKSEVAGGLGFDAQWEGAFFYPLANVLVGESDATRDLGEVQNALLSTYNADPFQRLLFTENHDTVGNGSARLPSRMDPANPGSWAARKRSMLAAGLLFTTPGVPMLFQGQEMLERGTFANTPEPLDWTKKDTYAQVRAFYKDMAHLRRNLGGSTKALSNPGITITHKNDQGGNKVVIYRRGGDNGEAVMVVANFTAKKYTRYDLGLPSAGPWLTRLDSDDPKYGADFAGGGNASIGTTAVARDGMPFTGGIALGPYSIVVLSK